MGESSGRRIELGGVTGAAVLRLRRLTGVDEALLDQVPGERARYTAMGGVVLGTATIAAFSMLIGLAEVFGEFTVLLFAPALLWGVFILNLDRWLIASSAGTAWTKRATVLVPRLLVACAFGVVIAEPLVLRLFQPAIEQHIQDGRAQDLRNLTSVLLRCNPDPNADAVALRAATQPDCDRHRMRLAADHATVDHELTGLKDEAAQLRRSIDGDNAEQARRDSLASNECTGTPGPGVSGKAGRGPECLAREQEARDYRSTHSIAERSARLTLIQARVDEVERTLAASRQTYQQLRDAEVTRQVNVEASHQGAIGLLERMAALRELTEANGSLVMATWFVRGFFILVDCLPVLVKFMSGTTRYDRISDRKANAEQRVFEQRLKTWEENEVSAEEATQYESRNQAEAERAKSDAARRWADAQLQMEISEQIRVLAEQRKRSYGAPSGDDSPEGPFRPEMRSHANNGVTV